MSELAEAALKAHRAYWEALGEPERAATPPSAQSLRGWEAAVESARHRAREVGEVFRELRGYSALEWSAALAADFDATCFCLHTKVQHYSAVPVCMVCACDGFLPMTWAQAKGTGQGEG